LKPNEKIFIVEYKNQSRPGMFFSKDKITTVIELRERLAVLKAWKDERETLVLREYEVISDFKVRDGIIGHQTEKTGPNAGKVYPGGGHQYESLVNFRKHDFSEYLKATGFEITLK
jgi:hypothetical protein